MAEANDVYGSICENLIDAGCDTQTTKRCMALVKESRNFSYNIERTYWKWYILDKNGLIVLIS